MPEKPYQIEDKKGNRVVLRFAAECNHRRERAHDEELQKLVETRQVIACDLSETEHMASEWIRLLVKLNQKAKRSGARFGVVGVRDTVLTTADYIGMKDKLDTVKSVEEVWQQ